jgi:cold shock CspA family protein
MTKDKKQVGRLNYWNEIRGFGFVHQNQDGVIVRYFLHVSQIMYGSPIRGSIVYFNVAESPKGLEAQNAEIEPITDTTVNAVVDAAAVLSDAAKAVTRG